MTNNPEQQHESNSPLDADVQSVVEDLAATMREARLLQRRSSSWAYGDRGDNGLKQSPSVTQFNLLPENQKEIERGTARTVIQGLRELGYEIQKAGSSALSCGELLVKELRQQLVGQAALSMDVLHARWQQCRSIPDCPPEIYSRLGEYVLQRGEAILAYDILSFGLAALESRPELSAEEQKFRLRSRQQLALALAQSGATEKARELLDQLCQEGHDTPETLGLVGRVYKDLASRVQTEPQRGEFLRRALHSYSLGFEKGEAARDLPGSAESIGCDTSYCGINAAAVQLLLGDQAAARTWALRAHGICEEVIESLKDMKRPVNYWLLATLAEAKLICGNREQARESYRAAARSARSNWRELASTRHQLRLLVGHLKEPMADWDSLFPKMSILVFTSPSMLAIPESPSGTWEARLQNELMRRLDQVGVIAGYLAGVSPVDVLLGEALLARGAELHFVLPFPRDRCRQLLATNPDWQRRFDLLLSNATSTTQDADSDPTDGEAVGQHFAQLRAYGWGALRARQMNLELYLWAMRGQPAQTSTEQENSLVEHWERLGCCWEEIAPPDATAVLNPGPQEELLPADLPLPGNNAHQIRAMLFADIKGYGLLDDAGLRRFTEYYLPEIARTLEAFKPQILLQEMTGDGLFLVFSDITVAIKTAVELRRSVFQTSKRASGLPSLQIRISLDAGPVYTFNNPVTRHPAVCGTYVNRAARIEPITPPNEVYASETFAALYVASGATAFRFDYVGQTQLPKGFGYVPLYCVSENPERS